jgi:hypothetical protein
MIRKINSLIILLILLSFSVPVNSQQAISYSAVVVDLWPEFDRPEMLVIYHLTLSPSVSLPADVTLQIPASVGEPSAVAVRQADGALFTVQYQRSVRDQWAEISLTATTPDIQLEYYDSSLTKDGDLRNFIFRWPTDISPDSFVINVQQPIGANGMTLTPALGSGVTGSDGLTYYSGEVSSFLEGAIFELTISYEKQGDELSMKDVQVQPGSPLDTNVAGQSKPVQSYLPWILGGLGAAFIVGGVLWYWQSGIRQPIRPKQRERRRASISSETQDAEEPGQIYCHQCGKRAAAGDRFCRVCGSKLRIES